jgi:hypothetical protein
LLLLLLGSLCPLALLLVALLLVTLLLIALPALLPIGLLLALLIVALRGGLRSGLRLNGLAFAQPLERAVVAAPVALLRRPVIARAIAECPLLGGRLLHRRRLRHGG